MGMQEMIKMKVKKIEFIVSIFRVRTEYDDYYTAYALLNKSSKMDDGQLDYPTFRENDTVGIDTAHSWHLEMTLENKLKDAKEQIRSVILHYLKQLDVYKGKE